MLAAIPAAAAAQDDADRARIVAVGDLHGDFAAWREIARAAGLVDAKGNWTGGETTLVQMGDVTDRGPDSLKIIRDLQRLERQAAKRGGRVIALLGNHEAMNFIGDLRYVHPGEYEAFVDRNSEKLRERVWQMQRESIEAAFAALDPPISGEEAKARWFASSRLGKIEHRIAWSPGGELGKWAAARPAVVKIGDTLFAHGGLSVERASEPLAEINARIAKAMAKGDDVNRSALEDPLGPLWYRGNITREASETEAGLRASISDELAAILDYHGAARLVVAHTPSLDGIVASEGGRLVRVDTGISTYYGGPASYLEILGDRLIIHQRFAEGVWTSSDLPRAGGTEP